MTTPRRNPDGQTPFGAWVQQCGELDSCHHSLSVTDTDMIFHRFKAMIDGIGTRDVQCEMWVEVKTFNHDLTESQHETLFDHHQLLCTQGKRVELKTPRGKVRPVWHFGIFVLKLSGSQPEDTPFQWGAFGDDGKVRWRSSTPPHEQKLIELLRFDRRPDHPDLKLDLRRHHKTRILEVVEGTALGFQVMAKITKRS